MNRKNLISMIAAGFTLVFTVSVSAQALHVDPTGNVGIGTMSPVTGMHLKRGDGGAQFLVEETSPVQAPRDLFILRNNGNPEFKMVNSGNNNSWAFSAGNRFVIKNNAGDWVSRLTANGDLIITGSITTAGGTCGGGCDLVFDPGTHLDSIEEHAKLMWTNSYLPAIGPTVENEPYNLSDKTGRMLNELEKAHIYIEQLHKRLAAVEASLR